MTDLMFNPFQIGYKKVVITKEMVEEGKEAIITTSVEQKKKKKKRSRRRFSAVASDLGTLRLASYMVAWS